MTVTVEVPEGHKFCKGCGGVFCRLAGFYQQRKFSKAAQEAKFYPCTTCKRCSDAKRNSYRPTPAPRHRAPARMPTVRRYITPRHPMEALCDTAFMGWRCATPGLTGARL